MATALLLLFLIDFSLIGLLPLLFFRRGRLTAGWLLTALPFFLAVLVLLAGWIGVLAPPLPAGSRLWQLLQILSVPFAAASIGLLAMAAGANRVPLALWHQQEDAPAELITWGPYARIRHPFYTSFLLAFAGGALLYPHWLMWLLLAYTLAVLTLTALREEKRLRASQFGEQYAAYMGRTGRFLPPLRSGS